MAASLLSIAPPPDPTKAENTVKLAQELIVYFLSHDLRRTLIALKHVLETSANPAEIVQLVKFIKEMDVIILEY